MMKSYAVFHIEQKMEFKKFNCGWKRVIHQTLTRRICFAYKLTGFYMIRGFTERYFLTDYGYILENHFYFVNESDYCFKTSFSRIFCVNSSVKVLSSRYQVPSTHLFRTSSFCTFIIYRKKEIGFVAKFFSKYFFGSKVIPNYMSS